MTGSAILASLRLLSLPAPTAAESERWVSFLSTLGDTAGASVARAAASLWGTLVERYPGAPLPIVLPATDDAQLEFRWETDALLLSVEFMSNGSRTWFFRNRRTGEWAGDDGERAVPQ